jgi:predicted outer membrane repeat protein
VIRNTLFLENVRKGLFTEGDNTLIENCIFFNQNGWYAVFDFYSRLLFSGCTIVGNQGYGISGYDSDIEIINSILWGNAFDELGVYSGNIAVTYSDIDDGGWEGEGNISESPLFCAPASLNFSLHETSPCVHSGKGGDHMGARGIGCRGGAPGKVHRVPEEYGTILEAIKQCYFYGDTVLVSPGTYAGKGNTNINLFEKQIVIKSEKGSDSTLILCRSEGVDKEYSRAFCALSGIDTSSIIQGFTIRNGYHGEGGAIALYDASPSILDCVFAGDTAIYSGGAIYCTGSPVISGCKFYDNLSTQGGGGIYFYEKANASPRIHESLFFNNVTTDLWGGAITIDPFSSPTQLTMSNCTIASNHASYSGGLSCFKFPVKVINSIFWDNTPDQISGSASVTYSDIKGGWTGQGNINSDPFFVNVKEQDFRLRSVSSCIDAGDLSFPNVPWGGSRRDMGALEYDQGWYLDREGRFIRKPIARNRNLIYPERD